MGTAPAGSHAGARVLPIRSPYRGGAQAPASHRGVRVQTNLRTKQTHSTQTHDSHFRRDNASQHYAPKENKTQTAKSTGTAPRKESNYITGLRGHPDEKMHVVNISLDL